MKTSRAIACVIVGAAAAVPVVARQRFRARVRDEVGRLLAEPAPGVGPEELRARWETLPEPVRRHLRYAIRDDAPAIRTARLKHGGSFRPKPAGNWFPVEGEQYFTVAEPGFVWHATIRPAPFMWIEARDRLLSGQGNMLVKFLSAVPIADASGAEIDQGASLRWLGECAWFPYAFAGNRIEWQGIDDRSALATLRQGGLPVKAVFHFDEEGKLVRLTAQRYRDIGGGRAVLTPWWGHYSDYRDFNGFRVPATVEGGWDLDEGPFAYARFRVTTLEYNVLVSYTVSRCHERS